MKSSLRRSQRFSHTVRPAVNSVARRKRPHLHLLAMAPKYKLTYFNLKGLVEPVRYLFAYGKIEYEDKRIELEDWPKVKSSFQYGKVPILEVDGKIVSQSVSMCRHLAKKVGLTGSNDWESLLIDAVVDTITDLRVAIASYAYDPDEASKAKKREVLDKETVPHYLSRLEQDVKQNGGYFVGGKLTWADLYFAGIIDLLTHYLGGDPTVKYPALQELVKKVNALPAIKDWIEKRPKTAF